MPARLAAISWLALALVMLTTDRSFGAEPLPEYSSSGYSEADESESLVYLESFANLSNEGGFFARWRADHQERAARDGWIETDRPSFTLSDATVPQGWLQLESGWTYSYNYEYIPASGFDPALNLDTYTNSGPELNLRYGLLSWVELRVLWAGAASMDYKFKNAMTGEVLDVGNLTATANMSAGVKLQVSEHRGLIPKSALIAELYLPTASGGNVAPLVDYIYTWMLTDCISLGGSTGAVFADIGDTSLSNFFQSIIVKYHHSPKLTYYAEFYTVIRRYSSSTDATASFPVFDAGVKWRPLANLQLDARIGAPLGGSQQMDGVFTGLGASVRY